MRALYAFYGLSLGVGSAVAIKATETLLGLPLALFVCLLSFAAHDAASMLIVERERREAAGMARLWKAIWAEDATDTPEEEEEAS